MGINIIVSPRKYWKMQHETNTSEVIGYTVVRIPYFVQLTEIVIRRVFAELILDPKDFLDFPQGFIASEVRFPANFCELGIVPFEADLVRFAYIKSEIFDSLERAAERLGD